MPISTVWILKYVQQCYVKWFWTISSLGAPAVSLAINQPTNKKMDAYWKKEVIGGSRQSWWIKCCCCCCCYYRFMFHHFHKNRGSVLVGNETQIIFDNLLDQYHMTTLLSLIKKCTNTWICDKKYKKCTHFS